MTADKERLEEQIKFIVQADEAKNIFRHTYLADGSRNENDAEHSWHLALMAMLLFEYSNEDINLLRVMKMVVIHDLVEIFAGDTFAYDEKGYSDKEEREKAAADKLFGMLPKDNENEIRKLWEEFDAMESSDSRFASGLDRLQPLLNNYATKGKSWKKDNVKADNVRKRISVLKDIAPELWKYGNEIIEKSVEKGYLKD